MDKFRQRAYHQPAAEDAQEAYLHGETLTERTIYFFIFIFPIDL